MRLQHSENHPISCGVDSRFLASLHQKYKRQRITVEIPTWLSSGVIFMCGILLDSGSNFHIAASKYYYYKAMLFVQSQLSVAFRIYIQMSKINCKAIKIFTTALGKRAKRGISRQDMQHNYIHPPTYSKVFFSQYSIYHHPSPLQPPKLFFSYNNLNFS